MNNTNTVLVPLSEFLTNNGVLESNREVYDYRGSRAGRYINKFNLKVIRLKIEDKEYLNIHDYALDQYYVKCPCTVSYI